MVVLLGWVASHVLTVLAEGAGSDCVGLCGLSRTWLVGNKGMDSGQNCVWQNRFFDWSLYFCSLFVCSLLSQSALLSLSLPWLSLEQ